MRTYPRNSPEAAARIVALALTADGHVCSSEDRALDRLNVSRELGLAPGEFPGIVQALCEDQLLGPASWAAPAGDLEDDALTTLMAEIDDPALRRKVMRLCLAVAVADDYLADGEIALLAAMLDAWRPHRTTIAI
ncbi:TerB family tellurite resistance protein [Paraburkholderia humisilvae]|uniref:Co-chaperone DjlA N-terminal domain-containing protein n=1 Tax=Paraburkholderia humisilvae TaxID=627669 RepID=A0A6J5E2R1_9BURK|nr:TerB family tellurite resistance protein [Paraburkholderia humisilvae]CAB3759954.1 hypothetical protein LMG29542_03714 [Paraburkholderia humisilvae]